MLAIENNRESHPMLNQIYDVLTELHNQEKQLALCKVPAHIGIKGNEETDKEEIDMLGMIITILLYTDYYLTIRKARMCKVVGK